MDITELFVGWAIESNRECDYGLAWWLDIVPAPLSRFETSKIQYDQATNDPYGCTWYAVMTAIANNRWHVRQDHDFQYFRDNAYLYGRAPETWMLLSKAGDMVVDYLNKLSPSEGWTKLAISLYDEWDDYMKKWYILQVWSIVNSKYFGFTHTGDITDTRWTEGKWHSRCLFYHTAYPARAEIENYVGVIDHNIIDISVREKIVEEKSYYRQAFIYYPKGKMNPQIPVEYNIGSTPYQQEVVHAREKIITDGRKPLFVIYTEEWYLENMKIDIWIYKAKLRGDI